MMPIRVRNSPGRCGTVRSNRELAAPEVELLPQGLSKHCARAARKSRGTAVPRLWIIGRGGEAGSSASGPRREQHGEVEAVHVTVAIKVSGTASGGAAAWSPRRKQNGQVEAIDVAVTVEIGGVGRRAAVLHQP